MPFLQTEGAAIFHRSTGEGKLVLFTHGYIATGEMWREQMDAVPTDHCFVTWDMRGHGRSSCPEAPELYSEEATVDDMAALLRHYGVDRSVLVGHSLGGYMSLAFRLRHPERVSGLVLVSSGPGYFSLRARSRWNRITEGHARKLEQTGLDFLAKYSDIDVSLHRSAGGLVHAARGMLAQRDDRVIKSLPEVDIPVLVIIGEHDQHYREAAAYMAARLPNARRIDMPGAGHMPNNSNAEEFNSALADFLAQLD